MKAILDTWTTKYTKLGATAYVYAYMDGDKVMYEVVVQDEPKGIQKGIGIFEVQSDAESYAFEWVS